MIGEEKDMIYRTAKSDFESFVEHLNALIPEKVDETIPELPIKDLVSRSHAFFDPLLALHPVPPIAIKTWIASRCRRAVPAGVFDSKHEQ
jgi:hypothetical protein